MASYFFKISVGGVYYEVRVIVFNATLNNISAISLRSVFHSVDLFFCSNFHRLYPPPVTPYLIIKDYDIHDNMFQCI